MTGSFGQILQRNRTNSSSGIRERKWGYEPRIRINGKRTSLGVFNTKEGADEKLENSLHAKGTRRISTILKFTIIFCCCQIKDNSRSEKSARGKKKSRKILKVCGRVLENVPCFVVGRLPNSCSCTSTFLHSFAKS